MVDQRATDAAQADATQALADAAAAQAAADAAQADATQALDSIDSIADTVGALPGSRPGDTPALFGQTKTGPASAVVPIDPNWVASSAAGLVLRIDAATAGDSQTVAPAAPVAIEPGRLYEVRWRVQRQTNPVDPLNDSVQLGIQWLTSGIAANGSATVENIPLVVADGVQEGRVRIALAAGPGVDLVAPGGTIYYRPFVDTFGDEHVTDLILIEAADVTAAESAGTGLDLVINWGADNTGASDVTAALTAALQYGGTLYIPDGNYLILRKEDGKKAGIPPVELWMYHVRGGTGIRITSKDDFNNASGPVVSADGRFIYFARRGPFSYTPDISFGLWQIQRYDRNTGETAQLTSGYGGAARPAISPDGKTLASGSSDETIRLWDAETGKTRFTLKGHTRFIGAVWSVAFSADGKRLASASVTWVASFSTCSTTCSTRVSLVSPDLASISQRMSFSAP
jgi:hypothetical protein